MLAIKSPAAGHTPPDGAIAVPTRVVEVSTPFINSASLVGETSLAIFKIAPGHRVPHKPKATTIHLHYDDHYPHHTFIRGKEFVFWFTSAGEFYSVEEPVPR